jgi:hypothetical protein
MVIQNVVVGYSDVLEIRVEGRCIQTVVSRDTLLLLN